MTSSPHHAQGSGSVHRGNAEEVYQLTLLNMRANQIDHIRTTLSPGQMLQGQPTISNCATPLSRTEPGLEKQPTCDLTSQTGRMTSTLHGSRGQDP